jgi:2,4'-dihydroxyacetophenone dioxygenase
MTAIEAVPAAILRDEDECPFVPLPDMPEGAAMQVVQVDLDEGLWILRNRFPAGVTVPTHKHTGSVYAFTLSGSWKYLEYPEVNTAGSYLYEPAGSVHTLTVPETNEELTEVWFAIHGCNLILDDDGNVTEVWDAQFILDGYYMLCEMHGLERPNVIGAP